MLKPEFMGQLKRDYKLALKRGCNLYPSSIESFSGFSITKPWFSADNVILSG